MVLNKTIGKTESAKTIFWVADCQSAHGNSTPAGFAAGCPHCLRRFPARTVTGHRLMLSSDEHDTATAVRKTNIAIQRSLGAFFSSLKNINTQKNSLFSKTSLLNGHGRVQKFTFLQKKHKKYKYGCDIRKYRSHNIKFLVLFSEHQLLVFSIGLLPPFYIL